MGDTLISPSPTLPITPSFLRSLRGDNENDRLVRRTDIERADEHWLAFPHADVCSYTGSLIVDYGKSTAREDGWVVRRHCLAGLNRHASAKIESLHLHH